MTKKMNEHVPKMDMGLVRPHLRPDGPIVHKHLLMNHHLRDEQGSIQHMLNAIIAIIDKGEVGNYNILIIIINSLCGKKFKRSRKPHHRNILISMVNVPN